MSGQQVRQSAYDIHRVKLPDGWNGHYVTVEEYIDILNEIGKTCNSLRKLMVVLPLKATLREGEYVELVE